MKLIHFFILAAVALLMALVFFIQGDSNGLVDEAGSSGQFSTGENNSDLGQGVLACHGTKAAPLMQNSRLDTARDFTLIQGPAIALKGINEVIKNGQAKMELSFVPAFTNAQVLAVPAFTSSQFMLLPCAALDANGAPLCKEGASTSILGKQQSVILGPDDSYAATIFLDGESSTLTAKGKIGDPGNIDLINSNGDTSVWRRDNDGTETLVSDSEGLHVEVVEKSDCSGSLNSLASDGTTVTASWQYVDSKTTTGTISIKSPKPNMDFDTSW